MSTQSHSFNVEYAVKYGVECAILINHFQFWIEQNRANERNFKDGRTWMYQTQKEIASIYPYFSEDIVNRLINKLVECEVLIKGNYNKSKFDKTLWYAFKNEEIFTMTKNRGIKSEKTRDHGLGIAEPIPDTKPDINKDPPPPPPSNPPKKPENSKEEEEDFSFLNIHNFSPSQVTKLRPYKANQIKEALEILSRQKIKKSKFGLLVNILENPENYKISLEEQFTQNQLLALQHNEIIKNYLNEKSYELNIDLIKQEKYMYLFRCDGSITTSSCGDKKSEIDLRTDFKESEFGAGVSIKKKK